MAEQDDLSGILGGLFGDGGADIDPEQLLKILEVVSKLGSEDKNMELLKALRPLLREENREKLDRAAGILRIISILPVLRDSGILGDILKL